MDKQESSPGMPMFYNQTIYSCERKGKIMKVPSRSISPREHSDSISYRKLYSGNSIEDSALNNTPLVPELKESYDRMLVYLEKLFRERFKKVREVVYKLHSGLSAEETINAYLLSNDETMKNIGIKKYKEIVENTLASEREAYIERLAHEVTILNEKVLQNEKDTQSEKAKACQDLEKQNKKLRLQTMSLKETIDEMKSVNEGTLTKLETTTKRLKQLESEQRISEQETYGMQNAATLRRENSILATQLRDMQEEMAETSNISRIQCKNATSLEMSNNMLNDRCNALEKENREFEEKLMVMSEGQITSSAQSLSRFKNKISKLKEALSSKTNQCSEYENEFFRINQMLTAKEQENSAIFSQYQELKTTFEQEITQKDTAFLEKIKSTYPHLIFRYKREKHKED